MASLNKVHKGAGMAATALITMFWISTVTSELFMTYAEIAWVKSAILISVPLLVASMVTAGATGARLAGPNPNPWAKRKQRRMMLAAANGLFVLVPAAIFLWWKASAGAFDIGFYAVQTIELVAGPANLVVLGLNARDGMRVAAAKQAKAAANAA